MELAILIILIWLLCLTLGARDMTLLLALGIVLMLAR